MLLFKAKKRIATLWFVLGGLLFILVLLQSILGKFENKSNEAWSWFFPNILPTLSLMLSVFLFDMRKKVKVEREINNFYFRLTFGLSLVYLITVLITLLIQPFTESSAISLMKNSNLYLGPFQGLITASIGLLFTSAEEVN